MVQLEKLKLAISKTDWESEFAYLLRYTERIEKVNDELLKQNSVLTRLLEKMVQDGNHKV